MGAQAQVVVAREQLARQADVLLGWRGGRPIGGWTHRRGAVKARQTCKIYAI